MAIAVGAEAPDFTLYDTNRSAVTLSTLRGSNVVLAFYPGAFTGVCQTELCTFRDSMEKFNNLNAKVLGISYDSPFANGAFASQNNLNFPLLSDVGCNVIGTYGFAFHDFAGIPGLTSTARAVVVVDANGVVRYIEVTANPGVEPNYDALMDALAQL